LPPRSFLTTSATSAPEMGGPLSELSDSASFEPVSVEEVLEVFLPPTHNVPS